MRESRTERQIWAAWSFLAMVLSVAALCLIALAVYSLMVGNVAFGLLTFCAAGVCGLSLYFRAGLGGLASATMGSRAVMPELHEREAPRWALPIIRSAPLLWSIAGLAILTFGFVNAARAGERAVTILCFPSGGTLAGAAATYGLMLYLARKAAR